MTSKVLTGIRACIEDAVNPAERCHGMIAMVDILAPVLEHLVRMDPILLKDLIQDTAQAEVMRRTNRRQTIV
jgi:hypothetical protein